MGVARGTEEVAPSQRHLDGKDWDMVISKPAVSIDMILYKEIVIHYQSFCLMKADAQRDID